MRQLIIARKDLNMSPGKLAAQCCHASLAFLTAPMRRQREIAPPIQYTRDDITYYLPSVVIQKDIYDGWICDIFTKTICEAKNRNQLLKAVLIAEELGLQEGEDFFLIKDACLTELTPEEKDENGVGRVLTCIGFRPLPDEIAHKISKKYQLYR